MKLQRGFSVRTYDWERGVVQGVDSDTGKVDVRFDDEHGGHISSLDADELLLVPQKITEDDIYRVLAIVQAQGDDQLSANLREHFASNCMIEG